MSTLIDLIRTRAKAAGLTQAALADACAVNRAWVGEVLTVRREPSPLLLTRLCALTGVTADEVRAHNPQVAAMIEAAPSLTQSTLAQLRAEIGRR